jgi:tellurite resistance protein
MEDLAVLAVVTGALLLAVCWLIGGWRKRRKRQPILQDRSAFALAYGGKRSETVPVRSDPAVSTSSRPANRAATAQWISGGQGVTIGGLTIERGLFYLGASLLTYNGSGIENCLVDPSLPVSRRSANPSGEGVPYYPSYSEISPESRRSYLEWLASARDNPETYIGYVFLYFYGLERRLFVDQAEDDYEPMKAEVERLLRVYGANRSFQAYACALLDAAAALANDWPSAPLIEPSSKPTEMPLRLRGAIGSMLKRGEPIPADWALGWYAVSPDFQFRTAALRCWEEFLALYRQRFDAKFPGGLSFRPPRRNLAVRYRAASGTFTATLRGDIESVPDIVSLTAPLKEVDRIVTDCTEALEPYSRLVGRNPMARDTLAAQFSLPRELLQRPRSDGPLAAARARLEAFIPKASAMVVLADVMSVLQIDAKSTERFSKSEVTAAAAALENLGFALEPDPRQGGPMPSPTAEVMVFRHHGQGFAAAKPSAEFLAARSHVEIAVLVAAADGDMDGDEARMAIAQIKEIPGLSEFQRARLIGYLGYLVRNPPTARSVTRFKDRALSERKALAEIAVSSAAADGHLDVTEIKLLEKTYKTLGLAKDDLDRDLHQLGAEDDEPPVVARGTPERGVPIPAQKSSSPPRSGITLDKKRIARIQAETTAVKSILDQVFNAPVPSDEEDTRQAAPAPIVAANVAFSGLDARHASLLSEIISQDSIDTTTFSELARKHGLFAAGAIEAINEWSFEHFDEALLDEGDPIEIARHLIRAQDPTGSSHLVYRALNATNSAS